MSKPAFWLAALTRRTSVFACGENLGGGAIHLPRALKYRRVERPTGVEPKKKDSRPFRRLFFSALHRIAASPQLCTQNQPEAQRQRVRFGSEERAISFAMK